MGGHRDSGDLRLVAHLSQEESNQRRPENAEALGDLGLFFFDLVGDHRPDRHADEGRYEHPAQNPGADRTGHPGTQRSGQAVVHERGGQDAQDDGHRLPS